MTKKTYARYPSCFGRLDCRGLMDVAHKHGMEIITARKPGMHVYNEIGLYGTAAQMKLVEKEWKANGNELKPSSFTAVFEVNLNIPRTHWVDTKIAEAKSRAIPTQGGWKFTARNGDRVTAPPGYRPLREKELPLESDIAYNASAKVFEPVDMASIKTYGAEVFKRHAHGILRSKL